MLLMGKPNFEYRLTARFYMTLHTKWRAHVTVAPTVQFSEVMQFLQIVLSSRTVSFVVNLCFMVPHTKDRYHLRIDRCGFS